MPILAEFPYWFLATTAVATGLVFGSFLNVVIHRLPRGENIAFPGSHCPACGAPIHGYDNIPIFSWVLLGGRARCCKARISPRYPLVELIGGLLAWAILQVVVLRDPEIPLWLGGVLFAAYLALGLGLVAAAFIDVEHMILPDEITLGGAVLGLATAPLRSDVNVIASAPGASWLAAHAGSAAAIWGDAAFGALIGFLMIWLPFDVLYKRLRGRTGMAMGDAKLVLLAGAWFGWPGALFALLAGAVQGTAVMAAVLVTRGRIDEPEAVKTERAELRAAIEAAEGEERTRLEAELADYPLADEPEDGVLRARLPFGPFLVLAVLELMLFGRELIGLYLDLMLI
jgi:leader peptidase (prepilin peptidase)/N-methyltransferase